MKNMVLLMRMGGVLFPFIYDEAEIFMNGTAFVTKDDEKFYINKEGKGWNSVLYKNGNSGLPVAAAIIFSDSLQIINQIVY